MYKKLVKYEDFNGEEQTEELWFHLTKAEIIDLEVGEPGSGSLSARLQTIIDTKNGEEMFRQFKRLLEISHGVKSPDGRHFVKNEETRAQFLSSAAYSALIEEMLEDTDFAIEFVLKILPKGLQEEAQKLASTQPLREVPKEPRKITRKEMVETDDPAGLSREIATGAAVIVDDEEESPEPVA